MVTLSRPRADATDDRNYPKNCWWVAATTAEITRKPVARWFLDTPVVLYRTLDESVVALEDRCLHRWAQLSDGQTEGDTIVCPYHGARFAPDGRCVSYPTQAQIPDNARIRSFATLERGPFIWIWMGDEASRQAAELPPELPFVGNPFWTVVEGRRKVDANYMLIHENVLDLTHFNYLHVNSLKISTKLPPRYWSEGNIVRSEITYDLAGKTLEERHASGVFDPAITSHVDIGAFMSPACHLGSIHSFAGSEDIYRVTHINHFVTPAGPRETHYWWHFCIDTLIPADAVGTLRETVETAFGEDSLMLESIQKTTDRDPRGRNYIEVSFNGDLGGLKARQALRRIMAAEAAGEVPFVVRATTVDDRESALLDG